MGAWGLHVSLSGRLGGDMILLHHPFVGSRQIGGVSWRVEWSWRWDTVFSSDILERASRPYSELSGSAHRLDPPIPDS